METEKVFNQKYEIIIDILVEMVKVYISKHKTTKEGEKNGNLC